MVSPPVAGNVAHGAQDFGKLRSQVCVDQVWSETVDENLVMKIVAGGVETAADLCDIAGVIDFMAKTEIVIDVFVFNSAIDASNCSIREGLAAANRRELHQPCWCPPTRAPLWKIEGLLHQMELYEVQPDSVFAETYLSMLSYGRLQNAYTFEAAKANLADVPEERLKAAKAAMH